MKRILFFCANDIYWGGSEELWLGVAKNFLTRGLKIAICLKKWETLPPKLKELETNKNADFIFKRSLNSLTRIYNKIVSSKYKLKGDELYKSRLLKWKPDIVIISQGNNQDGLEAMHFFLKNGIRYFTISQAVYEGIWPSNDIAQKMVIGYKNATYNYFVCQANKRLTEIQLGDSITNSKVVSNPFNVPYTNSLSFPSNEKYKLACVARFEFYAKGQDVLLQVMNDSKWKNRNIEINLFGSGHNEEGIRKLIKYFNVKNVFIRGFASPVDIWKENHALVLASRFEGLPLALVEAMLCARFGIVTDVSGNAEVIIDNVNGFIAEAPKVEYLDAAMERAWSKRMHWEEVGRNAQVYIKSLVSENPANALSNDVLSQLAK